MKIINIILIFLIIFLYFYFINNYLSVKINENYKEKYYLPKKNIWLLG